VGKIFYVMSFAFAAIWIVFWGWVFNILNDPSTIQVIAFIIIGIGAPLGLGKVSKE